MRKPLRVPFSFQQPYEYGCAAACAKMVLAYGGTRVSLRQMVRELRIGKTSGTYMTSLGTSFLMRGYDVTLISNFRFVRRDALGMQGDAAARAILEKCSDARLSFDRSMQKFIEHGGRCKIRPVTRRDLRRNLDSGFPPMVYVHGSTLWRAKPGYQGHVIVLTGLKGQRAKVLDPYKPFGGKKTHDFSHLMHACRRADSTALLVRLK